MQDRCLVVVMLAAVLVTACARSSATPTQRVPGGVAARGQIVLQTHGCVACHTIPGVKYAHGKVAPPLIDFGKRGFIGGMVPNTPSHLVQWLMNPQSIKPKTDMPNMDLTAQEARDAAAYLYTLH
ncbi:MAG TPA: c-type cytochrome [Gemmatimonadaceae bacterium]|nr:c-type cytochrome [Gemmatimonadaceae bacterium]